MAETRETTIIDVRLDAGTVAQNLGDVIKKISDLKAEQVELTKAIKDGNDADGEKAKRLVAVKDALSWNEKQAKALTATTKLLTADSATYADTLNGQRQKLADLQKAYAELTKEQRDSEGGKAFLKSIKEQSDAVKEIEAAMGDHRRNVGNYPKEITALVPGLGAVTAKMDAMSQAIEAAGKMTPKAMRDMAQGFKTATVQALKFVATPIGMILGGIALAAATLGKVFDKLAQAFKKNDDAGTNLHRLFASFQPVLTFINKAFDGLATVLGKVAGKMADMIAFFSDGAAEAQALVTSVDDLQEAERQYAENSAERMRDVAKLRDEAASTTDLDKRKELLKQAIELEAQNLEDEKSIAKQRLDSLVKTAEQEADTSDATKDAIAQARAAMYKAEEAYYTGTRRLNKELLTIGEQQLKARQDQAKAMTELEKKQAEDERKIRQIAEDFAVSLIDDEGERKIEARRIAGEREIEEMQRRLDTEKDMTEQARAILQNLILEKEAQLQDDLSAMRDEKALQEADKERERQLFLAEQRAETVETMRQTTDEEQAAYEEARWEAQKEVWQLQMEDELANIDLTEEQKEALREKWNAVIEAGEQAHQDALTDIEARSLKVRQKNQQAFSKAVSGFLGAMSNALAELGEDNKEAAIASKAIALGQIAVETGIAMAAGIKDAMAVPFPANIAAIATTITAVLTGITSAVSTVKSAKFSTGGVVGGGAYGQGDTVPAMLSPQEVVLNPTQTAQTLFAIANGGAIGNTQQDLVEALSAAVANQPAPVMDYREFTQFGERVATYNEIARV